MSKVVTGFGWAMLFMFVLHFTVQYNTTNIVRANMREQIRESINKQILLSQIRLAEEREDNK